MNRKNCLLKAKEGIKKLENFSTVFSMLVNFCPDKKETCGNRDAVLQNDAENELNKEVLRK